MSVASPAPTLRHRLRADTRAQHIAVENTTYSASLAAGTPGLEAYAHHVASLHTLFWALEDALSASRRGPLADLPGPWSRAASAREDLAVLARNFDVHPACPEPARALAEDIAGWVDDPALLGVLYVTEGSALGGLTLRERLLKHHPGLPTTVLVPDPVSPGRRWHALCDLLSAVPNDWSDRAVEGARATFAGLTRTFHHLSG